METLTESDASVPRLNPRSRADSKSPNVILVLSLCKQKLFVGVYKNNKRNARSLPGVINDNAKAKVLYHLYCAFSELLCIVHMLRKLYKKNTE